MKENCATASGGATEADARDAASAPLRIWALDDGRTGHRKQAAALADAVAERLAAAGAAPEVSVQPLRFRPGAELLPAPVWDQLGAAATLASLTEDSAELLGPAPDLAIGAGRRAAPVLAALRKLNRGRAGRRPCRAVQILWPRLPVERFDVMVAPAHDRLPVGLDRGPAAGKVIRTLGALSRRDAAAAERLAAAPDPRFDPLPRPLLGVLVGGRSGATGLSRADGEALAAALADRAAQGWGVAATGSRRTPPRVAARLAEILSDVGGFWWDGAGDNPFAAILAKADAFLVTADSVNMACEAAETGRPLFIAPVARLAGKIARFQTALADAGHARPLSDLGAPETLTAWRAAPLAELPRVAEAVAALLTPEASAGPSA